DHPPADEALETAERQKAGERPAQPLLDASREPEEDERHGEDEADGARDQPVRPFPPEDRLELVDRHALVDLLILRDALVALELLLPSGSGERGDGAVDRLPFGNGKARAGQPRRAADEDEDGERDQHDGEPAAHLAAVAVDPVAVMAASIGV